jgi:hypothetical protein
LFSSICPPADRYASWLVYSETGQDPTAILDTRQKHVAKSAPFMFSNLCKVEKLTNEWQNGGSFCSVQWPIKLTSYSKKTLLKSFKCYQKQQ